MSQTAVPATEADVADGRPTVATLSELLSPQGVALPAADNARIAVLAAAPRRRFATAPPRPKVGGHIDFEGAEHTYLGDNATLRFDNVSGPASANPLNLPNGLSLTYGQIVALGGDFYGLPDQPISDDPAPPARFLQAFDTLASDNNAPAEVKAILQVMAVEIAAVNAAIKQGKEPSTAYEPLAWSLSGRWNRVTGGGTPIWDWYPLGRYLKLALTNWDHFGSHAVQCYTVGHAAALDAAVKASQVAKEATREQLLGIAYAMNAFADHYLTDLFSAGHMRTPRKELSDEQGSLTGSLLALFMHDEDCRNGLDVSNALGQSWQAFGDKRLRDSANAKSLQITEAAVQTSVDEVWQAYQGGTAPPAKALDHAPRIALLTPRDRLNPAALFFAGPKQVLRRTNIADPTDHTWVKTWDPYSTIAELRVLPFFRALGDRSVGRAATTDILRFYNNPGNGRLAAARYGVQADGSYGKKWSNGNLDDFAFVAVWVPVDMNGDGQVQVVQFFPSNGRAGMKVWAPNPRSDFGYEIAWVTSDTGANKTWEAMLAVDQNGDGSTELLQCWDNGGQLGMVLYAPSGKGYAIKWQQDDVYKRSDSVAWIPVDIDGDGRTEIVQCTSNGAGQTLGMVVYEPFGDGYRFRWASDDMQQGSGATAWLPVDVDGDGRTEIVQCWSLFGMLHMIVYKPSGQGYTTGWASKGDMGEGSPAEAWRVIDVNGDGKSEILQIWNSGGQVGMITYTPLSTGYGYGEAWRSADMGTKATAKDQWLDLSVGAGEGTRIAQLWDNGGQLALNVYEPATDGTMTSMMTVPDLSPTVDGVCFVPVASYIPVFPT